MEGLLSGCPRVLPWLARVAAACQPHWDDMAHELNALRDLLIEGKKDGSAQQVEQVQERDGVLEELADDEPAAPAPVAAA
jgi:hypothetical protein